MRKLVLALVIACLVPTVYAQEGGRGSAPFIRARVESETVKGAPYSAEVVNQSIQTLSDGNRIVRTTTSRVYRDSEGRVRREEDRPSGSAGITIIDPVAGLSWVLNADNRVARQSPAGVRLYSASLDQNIELERLSVLLNGQPQFFTAARPFTVAGGRGAGVEQNAEERLS